MSYNMGNWPAYYHSRLKNLRQVAKKVIEHFTPRKKRRITENDAENDTPTVRSILSCRFEDAYARGLNGKQAAWAARKYRGHRVLPETILDKLEAADI
ncbi:hypothetical protein DXG01_012215 [Tephrocybe rancida]|nr:hypothetical protein DXG01_012215 [Tephrocybe rancida]